MSSPDSVSGPAAEKGKDPPPPSPEKQPPKSDLVAWLEKHFPAIQNPARCEEEWRKAFPSLDILREVEEARVYMVSSGRTYEAPGTMFLGWFKKTLGKNKADPMAGFTGGRTSRHNQAPAPPDPMAEWRERNNAYLAKLAEEAAEARRETEERHQRGEPPRRIKLVLGDNPAEKARRA